jgi:hypothetical protein
MDTKELAHRTADGVEVTLRWHPAEDRLSVLVDDTRLGERFELAVEARESPLDVFEHPYAYASAPSRAGTTIFPEVASTR